MKPEEALAQARSAAAAAGAYEEPPFTLEASPASRVSRTKLLDWALVDPDVERVYSTRALGAPITFVKRGLVRALRQWVGEGFAETSRFNLLSAAHILNLEERVRELEDELARLRK